MDVLAAVGAALAPPLHAPLALLAAAVVLGTAVTLPGYAALLRRLERECPSEFERLGRPSLWMASPERSLALQRFLYFEAGRAGLSPSLLRLCRWLAIATPLHVGGVATGALWLLVASLAVASAR
ncbi:MAG: hypothetical protein R3E88_21725 [Myxococcota bacterium]